MSGMSEPSDDQMLLRQVATYVQQLRHIIAKLEYTQRYIAS
jgi:hypothetical protein